MTVMVVDDEYDLQQAVKGVLEDEGFEVVTCSTGEQAMAALKSGRPEVLLLDLMLPAMSGYEVLDRVREQPALHDLPIVIMSAVCEPVSVGDRSQAFLRKPFSAERLIEVVQTLKGA
jgi:CheY-like chemotaxis protein